MSGYLPTGYINWTDDQLKIVNRYLIEFVVNYRSSKTGKNVFPGTMKGYILGLKRFFKCNWGYDIPICDEKHHIFGNVYGGLWTVMDNRFRKQQSEGKIRKSHNVLSKDDLMNLFCSPELSGETPRSFQC